MISRHKSIILFFALANITFIYTKSPQCLTSICLDKIYKRLTNNLIDENFISQLDNLPENIIYNIKKMLIDTNLNRLWYIFSKEISRTALVGHKGRVTAIAISPDTSFIVTATDDNTACLWRSGNCIRLVGHNDTINCISISSDNHYVATGSADNTAAVWDAQTGNRLLQLIGHNGSINSISISHNNEFIVTGSSDSTACVWHGFTGRLICQLIGHTQKINSICILPDNHVITASNDKTLKLWDNEGNILQEFEHRDKITIIRPFVRGFIIMGTHDFVTYYWDVHKGFFFLKDYSPSPIERVVPLHDFKMISILDKTISLKMLRECEFIKIASNDSTRCFKRVIGRHISPITAAEISSDLSFIVSGSAKDNVIYIWSIRPTIEKLLSPEISIKYLISILELDEEDNNVKVNNSTCVLC